MGRFSLVGYPVDCGKWIEVFLFSSCLHYTNSKMFVLKISVLEVSVVACDGFFVFHVIDSVQINKTHYWLLILHFIENIRY